MYIVLCVFLWYKRNEVFLNLYIGFGLLVAMNNSNASISSIPVELQYAIAKCCGLDYTAVFNLLCLMPGLKTYVESFKHLKQELTQGFLEVKEEYEDGNKVSFFVKGGERTGEYKKLNGKGALLMHSHYKRGLLEGECKEWYDDGQLRTLCCYKNGGLEGEYNRWHDNGQLQTRCFYKNDKLEGECKRWNYDGQFLKHSCYENGAIRWWI